MPKTITGGRPELRPCKGGAAAIDIGSKMHMAAVGPTCTDTSQGPRYTALLAST